MLNRVRIFLFLILIPLSILKGVNNQSDSLKRLLSSATDVERLSILLELSEINNGSPEAILYAKEACDIARKNENQNLAINALNTLGRAYYQNYEEEQALKCFFESLSISEKVNDTEGIISTLRFIGKTYMYLDSIELAFEYLNRSRDLSVERKLKIQEGNTLQELAFLHSYIGDIDNAILFINQAISIQNTEGVKLDEAFSHEYLGDFYYDLGNFSEAIVSYNQSIRLLEELNDRGRIASAMLRLGNTHMYLGNYQLALEQYQQSLSLYEQLNHVLNIALVSYSIGQVYENLSQSPLAVEENKANYQKSLEFHERSLAIFQNEDTIPLIGKSLNSIANVYSRLADNQFITQYGESWEDSLYQLSSNVILASFGKAVDYYNRALDIFELTNDLEQIAGININLGRIRSLARNWDIAFEHLNLGLNIAQANNFPYHTALAHFFIGDSYFSQGKLALAKENLLNSALLAKDIGMKEIERYSYHILSRLYERQGNYVSALVYHRMSVLIKDEIFTEKSQKAITEMQTKYESEKKEQEITLLNNQKALQASQIQRQRLMIAAAVGGFILIFAFALLLLRMFQQKKRANRILEEKNELISHQKQEITDSIRYASRIQGAVLPSPALLNEALNEYFVLFLPRDIVSGDFFWVTKHQGKVVLVAADCTGHGVPGAFMSMLGVSFLYEIVNKEGILQPSNILDTLRELIKETLSQTGKMNEQKDGMDISLGVLDYQSMTLEWAGAYNPLVIIRNKEIIEYKANKMPVAVHINDHLPFTNHEVSLQKGDTFYLFSDGYPDQFGGEDGRKFMSKRFKQLLVDINDMPMEEQREFLYKAHLEWRGNFEQIDDVIVLGVRV